LTEILTETRLDIRQGVEAPLLERERSLQRQLSTKSESLTRLLSGKHTDEQEAIARRELEAILKGNEDLASQIRAESPQYAALTQPQPFSVEEIQRNLLDNDTLLLEFALGIERSYLWVLASNSITSFELPKRSEIEATARRVYETLTARNRTVRFEKSEQRRIRIGRADREYLAASRELSQTLLGPVAKQLGRKRLLIVSEGALQYIPFGALPLPALSNLGAAKNRARSYVPMMMEHEIVSLPSLSALAAIRNDLANRKPSSKTVIVLADPVFEKDDPRVQRTSATPSGTPKELPKQLSHTRSIQSSLEHLAKDVGAGEFRRLPYSRREAAAITALTPKAMRKESLDFDANLAAAMSDDLSNYRIIHFATHALINSVHPERSGIVLSLVDKDGRSIEGYLRLAAIYNLKLRADLVVLSACRTALGKDVRGEGLVGLTRGFMYAGAPRVIASLWAVDDEATAVVMKRFYRQMLVKQQRPAEALRSAQVSILKDQGLPPYYWAAFVLQGEWK
jgi:CHAT domain-containing protein